MQASRIVVAISATGVVIGPLLIEFAACNVTAVDAPVEAAEKSLKTRQRGRNRTFIFALVAVFINPEHIQQHAVGIVVALEHLHALLERVVSHPVVAVQKGHEPSPSMSKALVASLCLTAVLRHLEELHAAVFAGVGLQNIPGFVGRAVVDAKDLNILQRLSQKRIQTLLQIGLRIVNCHQNRNALHFFFRDTCFMLQNYKKSLLTQSFSQKNRNFATIF